MAAVKQYKVTPLKFDQNVVDLATRRKTDGDCIAVIAKALKMPTGKAAMAVIIGTTELAPENVREDPAKLARALVKDREAGMSWPKLAARYGIGESTTHVAYEAATGKSYKETDYRKGDRTPAAPAAKPAKAKRAKRPATAKQAAKDRAIATAAPRGDA